MNEVTIIIYRKYLWNPRIKVKIASSWEELPRKDLLRIIATLYSYKKKNELLYNITRTLLNIPWMYWVNLTNVQKVQLQSFCKWVLTADFSFTKNIIPTLKVRTSLFGRQLLYGPKDELEGMIGKEFLDTDVHFMEFNENGNISALDNLIACLYRPKVKDYNPKSPDFNGEIRENFNEHLVEARAEQIARISLAEKLAVYHFYKSCRKEWEEDFDLIFSQENQTKAQNYGWGEVFFDLSGDKFGTLRETEENPITNLLLDLQIRKRRDNEYKAKLKEQKNVH